VGTQLLYPAVEFAVAVVARDRPVVRPPRAAAGHRAVVFFWIVLSACAHWMIECFPAILSGRAPQDLLDSGLFTDPAAVLDLSLLLPALAMAAIMLLRRRPLGFVLGPVLLAFAVLVSLMLVSLFICLNLKGLGPGYVPLVINFLRAAAGMALLALFFRPQALHA
jgi:hypothetical protein